MDIYIYSDESGVFDKAHNDFFVFGGVLLLSLEEKEIACRKYIHTENLIRRNERLSKNTEIKASGTSVNNKRKLFNSVKDFEKFGIIVRQKELKAHTFNDKKTKQRYLDWAYKYAVKKKFEMLIYEGKIVPHEVENIYFYIDEHTTATDGIYELEQSLEQEFKIGLHNFEYQTFFPPLFRNLKTIKVSYCNSSSETLIRTSDIIANRLFHAISANKMCLVGQDNFNIVYHPMT